MKRYGALFTCLSTRVVHIKVVVLYGDGLIHHGTAEGNSKKMNFQMIRSDSGSNFIGAENELYKAFNEMDHIKNTRTASHMSGVWEQQICSARKILSSLLKTHGRSLNDQALSILMAEVEAVMNSRPLTVELLSNGNSLNPINPSNLLMIKSSYVSSW